MSKFCGPLVSYFGIFLRVSLNILSFLINIDFVQLTSEFVSFRGQHLAYLEYRKFITFSNVCRSFLIIKNVFPINVKPPKWWITHYSQGLLAFEYSNSFCNVKFRYEIFVVNKNQMLLNRCYFHKTSYRSIMGRTDTRQSRGFVSRTLDTKTNTNFVNGFKNFNSNKSDTDFINKHRRF